MLDKMRAPKIVVIGLGYVGLPLAIEFAKIGHTVYGLDINIDKIESLRKGLSYIDGIESSVIEEMVLCGTFRPSSDTCCIAYCDVAIICVPTPLNEVGNKIDLSYVETSFASINRNLHKDMLVILESTVQPGCTTEMTQYMLEGTEYILGEDVFVCFSPERIDPGNKKWNFIEVPKVIAGETPLCLAVGSALYSQIFTHLVPVSSTKVAEMTKLVENTFRSINIAFINDIALLCMRMGIDVFEIIEAAKTKPFGYMPFYPGPGIGGHCIPVDPAYLMECSYNHGYECKTVDLAFAANRRMPFFVFGRICGILKIHTEVECVLLLGMAYKPNISDARESPSRIILEELWARFLVARYHDPFVPSIMVRKDLIVESEPLEILEREKTLVVILTDHSTYDYNYILRHASVVLDTRNALSKVTIPHNCYTYKLFM